MGEQESKKTESKIEQIQDEELNAVAGGLWGITIYDKCSNENPARRYVENLCSFCPNLEFRNEGRGTKWYCGKTQKIIK